jgi:integrase/recombinase XerD
MTNFNENTSRIVNAVMFIDFKPAELRINKQWLIVYYAKNPISKKLERFRIVVPVIKKHNERKQYALKIVAEINKKLSSGWLPYYSEINGNFKLLQFCFDSFLKNTEDEVSTGVKRSDTLRAYRSYISLIQKFLEEKNIKINLAIELNKIIVTNYLDWIYFERKNSVTTYNNHLGFIGIFLNYCCNRGFMKENFTVTISKKTNTKKIRQIVTTQVKEKIKELKTERFNYFVLCMCTYYCFIRRTELCKLKVADIFLDENCIKISESISKNRKTEVVTIPNELKILLEKHIEKADKKFYLFSKNKFKPGKIQLKPKKISDTWTLFRNEKNIQKEFQFYSLKDTGITDLLNNGIPAIKVRNQARHYDLKITESYTARNINCDDVVKNSKYDF